MKLLVAAVCLLAGSVSANYGESGIVMADGTLVQFTPEEAANIAEIGESGVVMNDGTHLQFSQADAVHHNNLPTQPMPLPMMLEMQGPFRHHGIMMPDGNNVQFSPERHANIVLIGPSGKVTKDGNVQFDNDGYPVRRKRAVLLRGPSGVIFEDGQARLLGPEDEIVEMTETGAVLSSGQPVQFRPKRDTTYGAVVGESGLITPEGDLYQFAPGEFVVSAGPSAVLLNTGKSFQYSRKKRSATSKATVGESAIITPGGKQVQFGHGVTVVLEGPSAAILSDGSIVQYEH